MSRIAPEQNLPAELLAKATLRGNENAWKPEDVPAVIEAARAANLVNLGGQLQFRLADGGTCECYWVEVDTGRNAPLSLSWPERVALSATVAMQDFKKLLDEFDFIAEGQKAYPEHLSAPPANSAGEAMCFVWYIIDQDDSAQPHKFSPSKGGG